jgi:nucleoredoxin
MQETHTDNILTGKALSHNGEVDLADVFKNNDIILYYFSAHWCPPCRGFTPVLAECVKNWKAAGKKVECIFLSSDQSEEDWKEYFETMPWLAIPMGDKRKDNMSKLFGVKGIPTLIAMNKNGKVISNAARGDVASHKDKAIDEWMKHI